MLLFNLVGCRLPWHAKDAFVDEGDTSIITGIAIESVVDDLNILWCDGLLVNLGQWTESP